MRGDRSQAAWLADAAAAAALVLLQLVLYRKVLRLWWVYDDSNLLRFLFDTRWTDAWVSREVWPQQLFTPLMFTAFELQWAAFGIDPSRWYVVHLALSCVTAIALYAAARRFFDVGPSLAGAAIFIVGTPLCSLVTQLSTVHYFLAITLGALSVIAWTAGRAWVSAVLYFVALLAKEIVAPLPLLLWFLPGGATAASAVGRPAGEAPAAPLKHLVALGVYLIWRRAVIGAFLGAYSWVIEPGEWPRLLALLPWKVIQAAAGKGLILGLILIAIMAIVIALALRDRRAVVLLLVALAVAFGPILPVAKDIHPRYAVMPWMAWSFAFAAAVAMIRDGRVRTALLVIVPLLAIVVNRQEWGREIGIRQRMSAESRFFFEAMPPNGLLRLPATPPPNMREWNLIKTRLGKPAGATCFYDDYFLCANDVAGRPVWEYDDAARTLVDVTAKIPAIAKSHCSAIRAEAPLSVRFDIRQQELHWEFGPYAEGKYSALLADGLEAWDMPRRSALNLPGVATLSVRVRYESPQGWTTYSPPIGLDFVKQADASWQRPGSEHPSP